MRKHISANNIIQSNRSAFYINNFTVNANKNLNDARISCEVSNDAGRVTSSVAYLKVQWPPDQPNIRVNGTSTSSLTIETNANATFVATVRDLGNPLGQGMWYKGTQSLGQSSTTYNLNNAQESNSGDYTYSIQWQSKYITSNSIRLTVKKPNVAPKASMKAFSISAKGETYSQTLAENWITIEDEAPERCVLYIEKANIQGEDVNLRISGTGTRTLTITCTNFSSLSSGKSATIECGFKIKDPEGLISNEVSTYIGWIYDK